MPFFHIALDVIKRGWLTIEAPDREAATKWAKSNSEDLYDECYGLEGADSIEFSHILSLKPGEETKFTIEARLNEDGEKIEEAEDELSN